MESNLTEHGEEIMSIREKIMALPAPFVEDSEYDFEGRCQIQGFNEGKKQAADIAEKREHELLAEIELQKSLRKLFT